jgi:hypothetical protein
MSTSPTEDWADQGLKQLIVDLSRWKMPLSPEAAAVFIRAAYGRGYSEALAEADPLPILEASKRRDELALRIPVS